MLLPLILLLMAFWIYSIIDCAMVPPTRHRGVSKPVWLLIVILLPVVGGLLWLIVGRGRTVVRSVPRAPDDNPEFLGSIGSISDQDERIRRLEAELAALDAEADDDADRHLPPRALPQDPSDDSTDGPALGDAPSRD